MNLGNIDIDKLISSISSFGSDGAGGINSPLGNNNVASLWENPGGFSEGTMNLTDNISGMNGMNFSTLGGLGNQGGGGMFGDLFSDSGMLSKSNLATGSDLLGIGTGLMGMYNSFQDRNMMEDMVEYGKDSANRNLSNSALLTNQRLDDRAAAKNAWNPQANKKYQHVDGSAIK